MAAYNACINSAFFNSISKFCDNLRNFAESINENNSIFWCTPKPKHGKKITIT